MNRHVVSRIALVVAMAVVAFGCSSGSRKTENTSTLYSLATNVTAARGATAPFGPGHTGDKLKPGDRVRTDTTGRAELDWPDGSLTRLGPDTIARISPLAQPDRRQVTVHLDVGRTWNRVERVTGSGGYQVETPVAAATVRGTRFEVACTTQPACTFEVVDGTVAVTPTGGATLLVTAGQTLTVHRGAAPGQPRTVGVDKLNAEPFIAENERLDQIPVAGRSAALAPGTTTTTVPPAAPPPKTAATTAIPARSNATPSMIVFTNVNGNNVFALGSDGHVRQLTTDDVSSAPSVSPDGTKIAFIRGGSDPSTNGLWLMSADGSNAHLLTTEIKDQPLAWSPDGRRIAGLARPSNTVGIIAAAGGPVQSVPNTMYDANGVTWSPDGRFLAFHAIDGPNGGPGLEVVRLDGSGSRFLRTDSNGASLPGWRPNGRDVAYATGYRIWLTAADGTSPPRQITPDRPDCQFLGFQSWTADSGQLVEGGDCPSAAAPDNQPGIWIIDATTGHTRRLASGGGFPTVSGAGPFIAER